MGVIDIKQLTRIYDNNKGISDVTLSVEKGEVFGFLGPNGAGKTTTIRHLMGFLRPLKGTCTINELDCWDDRESVQKVLGYIPGEIALFNAMTGIKYLKFMADYRGLNDLRRMQELIAYFELDTTVKIKKMSKGMKQKLGIIVAFMHDPDVLILDEPTSGLDPLMQERFTHLVLEERNRGKTILMSSHMFDEVEKTCHRVGIIKDGKIVAVESVENLKRTQQKQFVITFESEEQARAFSKDMIDVLELKDNRVTVVVRNELQPLITRMSQYTILDIVTPTQTLEEVFMHYYGEETRS